MQDFDKPRQFLAIGLAGLAGFVDATGFMANGGYFVSFMSGNTTRLAVDLASRPHVALLPAAMIIGFLVGVTGGALLAARAGSWRKPAVLVLVALLLLSGALLGSFGHRLPALGAMVLAMGALNNSFQRDGEVTLGLTYMTGALVKLGQGLAGVMVGRKNTGWLGYLLLWSGLTAGALGGGFAFMAYGQNAQWLATGWAWAMALAAFRLIRQTGSGGRTQGQAR